MDNPRGVQIMGVIKDAAEKFWSGEVTVATQHPLMPTGEFEEVAAGVVFYRWFANFVAVKTEEGLVLVDTGAYFNQQATVEMVRRFAPDRVHTAIYTHGHVDHACGMPAFVAEAQHNRVARPRVVGHRTTAARFDRYKRTAGYNSIINTRQFSAPSQWPTEFVYPDTYFDDRVTVAAGSLKFECHHGRGETDDATWVYIPQRKVLCTGDFIIWAAPNAGNPQKAPRYAREWAEALRAMAKTGAEVLLPGHGVPVFGLVRVRQTLLDTAEYLQSLYDQTVALMNEGRRLDEIIHSVKPPANLVEKPYLQAVYDEPQFIVHNIWRLEGGWYDGTPSHLKPAPEEQQARQIAEMAGGIEKVMARALTKFEAGELAIAAHLIDWAASAAPDDRQVHEARTKIYTARAAQESSTMSYGIFRAAAAESAQKAGIALPENPRRF
ncbi:MAG TPA: alkyl sulfatase dimerization domain-containing protein [Candidatus Binataceae bacterium]|nr:alkyl sulfatase dimerization domain-containing protein [Candidatus Binataceae bacterium]